MGKGIDLARPHAPEHAAMMDDFKDQLLIALIRRLASRAGVFELPVSEVDATGDVSLAFSVDFDKKLFHFEVWKKH